MLRNRIVTRFVALFVVAFICLNAGGSVCVAYCQTFDLADETEHFPVQELPEHCNKSKSGADDSNAVVTTESEEADCCPFTISFVAAPVEGNQASVVTIAAIPIQELLPAPTLVATATHSIILTPYRGPPMDHRIDRLKNCIIRI